MRGTGTITATGTDPNFVAEDSEPDSALATSIA
jgi:hypothetical protein